MGRKCRITVYSSGVLGSRVYSDHQLKPFLRSRSIRYFPRTTKGYYVLGKLTKFGLPVWFIVSFSLWLLLPTSALLTLTPLICALLLCSISAVLAVSLYQLYLHQHHRAKGFYGVLCSAILAPPVAIMFSYKVDALLTVYPIRDFAALLWILSSMGAVLTIIVCRLMTSVISKRSRIPDHQQAKPKIEVAARLQNASAKT